MKSVFLFLGIACFCCVSLSVFADIEKCFRNGEFRRDKQLEGDFYEAVKNRNLIALKALLESGVPADLVKKSRDMSALTDAAFRNDKEMAKLLLDYGADPNHVSSGDLNPLLYCFTRNNNNVEIAQMLLQYGADVNFVSRTYKVSALDDALAKDYKVSGRLLRDYGGNLFAQKKHANVSEPEWREILAIKPSKKKCRYPSFGGKLPSNQEEFLLAIKKNPSAFNNAKILMILVRGGCIDGVRMLLKAGCNPNISADGLYPIVEAARAKNFDLVNLLLDYGANPHVVDAKKFNAVTYLISEQGVLVPTEENLRILRLFLEYGYKADSKNGWNAPAISDACFHDKPEHVKLLVAFGADPTKGSRFVKSREVSEALRGTQTFFPSKVPTFGGMRVPKVAEPTAQESKDVATVVPVPANIPPSEEATLPGFDVRKRYPDGQSELHVACEKGDLHMVKALIEQGADSRQRDNLGKTPLHILCSGKATTKNFIEILKFIVENEPTALGIVDDSGRIPFHYLCESRNTSLEALEMLKLEPRQIGIRETKNDRRTPLFVAIEKGNGKMALTLLENGAAANQTLRDGQTPLHLAAKKMLLEVVDFLTETKKGINIDARDKARMTPFLCACEAYSYSSSSSRKAEVQIRVLKLLVERGANPKAVNKDRKNALHLAVDDVHPSVVEFLIGVGVNVNAKDKKGHTPLYLARYTPSSVKQMLERYGAESQ